MSDRPDIWMPLFVADYLRDTQHLSTTEHGAYLLLLMHAWTAGGALPLDERRLARIAGLDKDEWADSGAVLLAFFREVGGARRHKRVDQELVRAEANLEERRAAGRASAAQRAARREGNVRSTSVGTDVDASVATPVSTGTSTKLQRDDQRKPNASPSPSPSPSSSASPCPPDLAAVIAAAGMSAPPTDRALLAEWLALPDMQLERDILPIVTRVANRVMETTGRVPFKLKLFDSDVRQQHASDEAAKAEFRRTRERIERQDREQAEARDVRR